MSAWGGERLVMNSEHKVSEVGACLEGLKKEAGIRKRGKRGR